MIAESLYLRGALVAYAPQARSLTEPLAYLPFRFNPESISRSFSASQGLQSQPADDGKTTSRPDAEAAAVPSNASSGSFRESFSLRLRFDVHEREQTVSLLPPALGVTPELAALETLMAPADDGLRLSFEEEGHPVRPEPPTLLLVWGPRVTPVRLTALRIDETVYNAFLNPVRAEVEASFEVISGKDKAQGALVQGVHQAMALKRRSLAALFLSNTAAQGGGILPL